MPKAVPVAEPVAPSPGAVRLETSYLSLFEQAADHGWLRGMVDTFLDPEHDIVQEMSSRPDVWLRMRYRFGPVLEAFENLVLPIVAGTWRTDPGKPAQLEAFGLSEEQAAEECDLLDGHFETSPGFTAALRIYSEAIFRGYSGCELRGRIGGFGDVLAGESLIPDAIEIPSFGISFTTETGEPRLLFKGTDPRAGVEVRDRHDLRWKTHFCSWGSREGGNWKGSGLGLPIFLLYWLGTQNIKDWAVANSRFGTPIPVAEVTEGWSTELRDQLFKIFRAMASRLTGLVLPKGVNVKFANEAMRSWPNFDALDDRLERKIRATILGVSDVSNLPNKGTYGAVRLQAGQLSSRQWAVAQFLAEQATRGLVRPACEYLFAGRRPYRLVPVWDDPVDPTQRREDLKTAADLGMPVDRDEAYDVVNFKPPSHVPDVLEWTSPAPPPGELGPDGMPMPGMPDEPMVPPKPGEKATPAPEEPMAERGRRRPRRSLARILAEERQAEDEMLGSVRELVTGVSAMALTPIARRISARARALSKSRLAPSRG